jgi:hypothetical protein
LVFFLGAFAGDFAAPLPKNCPMPVMATPWT